MTRSAAASFQDFKRAIWTYYRAHRRKMPWRENITPYRVVASEIMLQQTQVSRVIPKFESWMKRFPDWRSLAQASIKDILREWSGLGYNRRALYLRSIAGQVIANPDFAFLKTRASTSDSTRRDDPKAKYFSSRDPIDIIEQLTALPGIGPNTAGAIMAFAFNQPIPFIETNIRSVFIHFFFGSRRTKVRDKDIMPLIEQALAHKKIRANPCEWYYALMDYGAYLKRAENPVSNPSRKSAHHLKQKPFKGSNRELRSKLLRSVMAGPLTENTLARRFTEYPASQIRKNLTDLEREGFIVQKDFHYRVA